MKSHPSRSALCAGLSMLLFAASAGAADTPRPARVDAMRPCIPPGCGHKALRVLTYPAHALAFQDSPSFAIHQRGVEWRGDTGMMSLTVRRPPDYAGGAVRLTIFYQVIDDAYGDLQFVVTPMTFNHGNSYETYGSVGSDTLDISEKLSMLYEQTAVIPPGNGWGDGKWWYMDIVRQGSYAEGVRIMSVALEYAGK